MLPAQNVMLSYGRCCASPAFFDDFYQCFLASSPRVREKFAHTDMAAQRLLLRQGIMNLVLVARGLPATKLRQLGESHSRARLDIGPELYELWVACLLATLAQHDAEFSPALRQEWRDVLEAGIAVMHSHY
ncbi:globin domain-containing protein [Pseudomonas oryzihabitans]|uniref:globin domain-containing protein n=1 Tax=Pseudomonas oryzihabitans TaxID=47885 RepID=UPI002893B0C6|nr:globin domain-containing protein [Pseudomonas oryzihabitans]MDT3722175.1 globin domain-containing protein [Pseudomonas oryzihabitans]